MSQEQIAQLFAEHARVIGAFEQAIAEIEQAGQHIVDRLRAGNKVLICGNGGSAADAQHIAAEFVGRFETDRRALAAMALTTDTSLLTAWSNDHSYDLVFARQVEALGRSGDVLWAISTSGTSPNVLHAARSARDCGLSVIAFTGESGGDLKSLADIAVRVPATNTARIQEGHLLAYHAICAMVDRAFDDR